jgi:hypothetical protein
MCLSQVVHLATSNRQSRNSLRTQHGIICSDCLQEVAHACSSPTRSSMAASSQYLNEHQMSNTPGIPALQTHVTGPTGQGSFFAGHLAAPTLFESSISHVRLPPPKSSIIPSTFTSETYNDPCLTLSSPIGVTSSYPPSRQPGPSNAVDFQHESFDNNSWSGKRDLHHTDLGCEPERKRSRTNLREEGRNANQQSEFHPLPSFTDPIPPFVAPEAIMSPSILGSDGSSATSSEDDESSDLESGADWSIRYNSDVKREVDVSWVRSLDLGLDICCLTFSKDGKYLAVGFYDNGTTNIYDVQTGEKTWLVCDVFLFWG